MLEKYDKSVVPEKVRKGVEGCKSVVPEKARKGVGGYECCLINVPGSCVAMGVINPDRLRSRKDHQEGSYFSPGPYWKASGSE